MSRKSLSRMRLWFIGTMKFLALAAFGAVFAFVVPELGLSRSLTFADSYVLFAFVLIVYAYSSYMLDELKFEVSCLKDELQETKDLHEAWLKRLGSLIHLVAKDAGQDLFHVTTTPTETQSETSR